MTQKNLHVAKQQKLDEFYTQIGDIERECSRYREQFKGKVIFLNCDDPVESNFWRYFALNFTRLGLKKLIATHFDREKSTYKLELTGDMNEDGTVNDDDIVKTPLKQNGDFRSPECIEILKEADIIVTNPPFSLFREYVAKLVEYKKDFLIIGNKNAINYKEIFKLLSDDKIRTGYRNINSDMWFILPDSAEKWEKIDEKGNKIKHIMACWFTTLEVAKHQEHMTLYKQYSEAEYPKYDNYDAINVNCVAEIPYDYDGVMGVPITFLDKYNPDQFEILGLSQKVGYGLESNKKYDGYRELRQDGTETGSSGRKTNGNPVMPGTPKRGNYYSNGARHVYSLYGRIFIKRRQQS